MLTRFRAFWTPLRVLEFAIVVAVIYVTVWSLHPSLLFSSSTITGGDTGSHFAMPAFLRSTGNLFNLTPWYPGWYAGTPSYTYYFVLADYLSVLASYVINFAVAFKLATILGSVLMPVTAFAMGKLFKAPRPIPTALAVATLPFLFDASFTIDGGNLYSTMAGEYEFALSLALALLTIGLFARGVRTGRGYWLAAISLSLTLAAHVLPWFFAIAAIAVLVVFELMQRRGIGDPRDYDMVPGDYARPLRFAAGAGLLSIGLSAWWLFPFGTSQNLTNSMGYVNDSTASLHAIFTTLGWFNSTGGAAGDRWVIAMALVAFVAAFWVRDRLGMVLATLTALSLAAFVTDPQSVIWNERLVPFWFISIHLAAGWLVGYLFVRWIERAERKPSHGAAHVEGGSDGYAITIKLDRNSLMDAVFGRRRSTRSDAPAAATAAGAEHPSSVEAEPVDDPIEAEERRQRRYRRTVRSTVAVGLIGLLSTVPGLIPATASALHLNTSGNQVTNWAEWNYSGYQGKAAWPEFHDLLTTLDRVSKQYGCGRAMWEYNSDENRFGTPEALMTLPYWTNNCVDSMEGLFFESSATTPYHFLDQAELSVSPSDPQVGLTYGSVNVTEGVKHLQMLGVKYYIAFSPTIIAQADVDPQLTLVATTKKWPSPGVQWSIYIIHHSPVVEGLTALPNVVSGISSRVSWLDANAAWWLDPSLWGIMATTDGPRSWPRATTINDMTYVAVPSVRVTDVHQPLLGQSISFHVSRVGVPVEVKISYFPRWHAIGATGPYRVSPNLMVVVPTSKNVALVYGSTPMLTIGNIVTDVTVLAALVTLWFTLRRRYGWARKRRPSRR